MSGNIDSRLTLKEAAEEAKKIEIVARLKYAKEAGRTKPNREDYQEAFNHEEFMKKFVLEAMAGQSRK